MVHLEVEEAEASGKIPEEVATTTTIITTTITEAEGQIEVTTPQATEAATITVTAPLATTPQATAIRVMARGEVEGRLGEAEVSCCAHTYLFLQAKCVCGAACMVTTCARQVRQCRM